MVEKKDKEKYTVELPIWVIIILFGFILFAPIILLGPGEIAKQNNNQTVVEQPPRCVLPTGGFNCQAADSYQYVKYNFTDCTLEVVCITGNAVLFGASD